MEEAIQKAHLWAEFEKGYRWVSVFEGKA